MGGVKGRAKGGKGGREEKRMLEVERKGGRDRV